MKAKKQIGFVVLPLLLTGIIGYWIRYQYGAAAEGRLNVVSAERQIGMSYRQHRNDVRVQLKATGTDVAPDRKPADK